MTHPKSPNPQPKSGRGTVEVGKLVISISLQARTTPQVSHSYSRRALRRSPKTTISYFLKISIEDAQTLQIEYGETFPEKGIKSWLRKKKMQKHLETVIEAIQAVQATLSGGQDD